MNTKKLVVEIPNEGFFENYTETLRKLYTEAFIAKNHLLPSSLESFTKSMSLQAGKHGESKTFTEADLIAIAEETNNKYEEYATGGYTEAFRRQGESRYRSKSKILHDTFIALGCEEAAKKLKYVEEGPTENQKEAIEIFDTAQKEYDATEKETKEMDRYTTMLEASYKELKKKNKEYKKIGIENKEKAVSLVNSISQEISDAEKFAGNVTRIDTKKFLKVIKDIKKEVEVLQGIVDDYNTISEEEQNGIISTKEAEHIKKTLDIKQEPEEEQQITTEEPKEATDHLFDEILDIRYSLEDYESNLAGIVERVKKHEDNVFKLSEQLKTQKVHEPENDQERVEKIMELINAIEDAKVLKPVMISLMTMVL